MSYTVPSHRLADVEEVLGVLFEARRVVLTTHINADGDGAGSEVALASFLRERGAEAWIVNPTPYPRLFRFLLPDPDWVVAASDPIAEQLCRDADLAVVLDTGEVPRLGRVKPMIAAVPKVVVDHHPPGSAPIPGLSLRDPAACATGELVFDLLSRAGCRWDEATVTALYVAIVTDTGSFRHSNTSSRCHSIAAELIDRGADPEGVHRRVYGAFPARRLLLLREALGHLSVSEDGTVAWMTVPADAFRDLGAQPDDLEGLVDYPRSLEGVEVALLFRRIRNDAVKVSFRSNGDVDVDRLAKSFGGGGHVKASGAVVQGTEEAVRQRVIDAASEAVRAIASGSPPVPDQEPIPQD
jgi:phosphoesterase RecJ-like protein